LPVLPDQNFIDKNPNLFVFVKMKFVRKAKELNTIPRISRELRTSTRRLLEWLVRRHHYIVSWRPPRGQYTPIARK